MTASPAQADAVRAIVRRRGWNVTSYQILNPGFSYWIDPSLDAVAGYIERHGVRVVGGAPVCAEADLAAVVAAFESDAAAHGCGVAYFAAEHRLAELARVDVRRATFPIGAQPLWHPRALLDDFATHASLRAQLNRARNKGVSTRELSPDEAAGAAALHRCLREWMETRPLPPLHFLVETDTLSNLTDRRVIVARCDGRVVGFLVATPIPARRGWLIEQLIRGKAAPNGTAELLLHDAALMFERADLITLGLAPLAQRGTPSVDRAPRWVPHLLASLRTRGSRFFDFEGLEQFKGKFGGSAWDVVYLSCAPGTRASSALVAVTAAFSGEPLHRFLPHVLARRFARFTMPEPREA